MEVPRRRAAAAREQQVVGAGVSPAYVTGQKKKAAGLAGYPEQPGRPYTTLFAGSYF
jgi:hypothetical protein